MTIKLTVGLTRNPRFQPLLDGVVTPQSIELEFVLCNGAELFYRNLKYDEFDVSEMSFSDTLMVKDNSDGVRWDWSGLPVFLSKAFVWLDIHVNTESGIYELRDLRGKRVGLPDYIMTAALWMRTILKELYGIDPKEITWFNGRTKELSHGGILGVDAEPPPGVSINWLRTEQTLDVMLERGEIDAAYGFSTPYSDRSSVFVSFDRYGGTPINSNPRIHKLLPDGGKQVIVDYYKNTGIIPANHLIIVQNRILRQHPWVALELYKAFQKSKEIAYERANQARSIYLLFEGKDYHEQESTFGSDPYPLGVKANRKMIETLFRSSLEQGLIRKSVQMNEIFHTTTLDT
ncbi:hypothetical protein ACFLYR_05455 [Chloroflexota bacterium]